MMRSLRKELTAAVIALAAFTLVLGVLYPLLVTGVSQGIFHAKANGSLIRVNDKVVGSRLLGQNFEGVPWFHSRPSQTQYNPAATAFSNAGPNGEKTRDAIRANADAYLKREQHYLSSLTRAQVPADAVQTSASGVDPHISVANARIQAHRVAAIWKLPLATVNALINAHTDGRALGVYSEPAVNVLELNLALQEKAQ